MFSAGLHNQPEALRSSAESPIADEVAQGKADRWTPGPHQGRQRVMGELERDEHSVGAHGSPASGQVPQQQQPDINPADVRQRRHERQRAHPLINRPGKRGDDAGPMLGPVGKRRVEYRQSSPLKDSSARLSKSKRFCPHHHWDQAGVRTLGRRVALRAGDHPMIIIDDADLDIGPADINSGNDHPDTRSSPSRLTR